MKMMKRTLLTTLLLLCCFVSFNALAANASAAQYRNNNALAKMYCQGKGCKRMCKMQMKMYKTQADYNMKMYNMMKKMCSDMPRGSMSAKMYRMKMKMCRTKMNMYQKDYNMSMKMYNMYKRKCSMMRS